MTELRPLTEAEVKSCIHSVQFIHTGKITICILTAKNGFQIVGKTNTVSPEYFNRELGEKYAYQLAFNQLLEHLTFLRHTNVYMEGGANFLDDLYCEVLPLTNSFE